MAELQDFMLIAEKDRDEAMRIAGVAALSEFRVRGSYRGSWLICEI